MCTTEELRINAVMCTVSVREKTNNKEDRNVLKCFRYGESMSVEQLSRIVNKSEVGNKIVRGRPRVMFLNGFEELLHCTDHGI